MSPAGTAFKQAVNAAELSAFPVGSAPHCVTETANVPGARDTNANSMEIIKVKPPQI
jgi:hypothetical protein